jgi:hypothetical protein
MPEVTNAPASPPTPAQNLNAEYQRANIRNTPQFQSMFKNIANKAKHPLAPDGKPSPKPEPAKPEAKAAPEPPKPKAPEPPKPTAPLPQVTTEFGEEAEPETPVTSEEPEQAKAPEESEATNEPEAKPEDTEPAKTPEKKGKLSPWRLVDEWKGKAAKLERELAEAKSKSIPEIDAKQLNDRASKAEQRVKELEDELRFKDYEKHPEFIEQYQKPYEAEFKRAMAELTEINVVDAAGNERPAAAEDMLALLNLPLGKAQELAKSMFGDFTPYVMEYRRTLKGLMDKRQDAIQQAKTTGAEREKQRTEQTQRQNAELNETITKAWKQAEQDTITDQRYGKYFTPRESDPDWNQRLAKGFELVDRAFSDPNPRDPRLAPEDRAKVIKRHAALRYRAAAFGALRYENEKLGSRVAELEKELEGYKSTEPGSAGGAKPRNGTEGASGGGYTFEKLSQGLRKYVKPAVR